MSDEKIEEKLTYINDQGNEVFTSKFLRNRGTCCKSKCLHCPYGYTLKSYFIETQPIEEKFIKFANQIIADSKPPKMDDITLMLLSEGFGKKEKYMDYHITDENLHLYQFATFKDQICGIIEFSNRLSESTNGRAIKELFLKKEFQDQGLGIEHIKI